MAGILFEQVLLIEDDESHALIERRALKEYTRETVHVTSVAEGLTALLAGTFDLIVTDLHLPDSGNPAHVRTLQEKAPGIPIMVLTSSTSLNEAVEAMRLGASDFLVKNFDAGFRENLGLALTRLHTGLLVEESRRKLERELLVLKQVLENSADGLAVVNADGSIGYANSALIAFLRRAKGQPDRLDSICSEGILHPERLRDGLTRSLAREADVGTWTTEVALKDEKDVAFSMSVTGVLAADGRRSNISVVWVRNISEQKRRERFQREILSTTTHDLKGPLGTIIISAELLADLVKDNKQASNIVVRISSAAHGVVNLIDEFLSARRIQEGTFILRPVQQDVAEIILEVIDGYRTIAQARQIELKVEFASEELKACVDKLGLSRVLGNLLSNAVKFTPKGGSVSVSAEVSGAALHLRVKDTGSGMDSNEVKQLFERFSRLAQHAGVVGTGLGLFVVKSIVTAHGGHVSVSSKPGYGTEFELSFPAAPPVNERGEVICLDFV